MGRGNRHEDLGNALLRPRTGEILGEADPLVNNDHLHYVPQRVQIDDRTNGHSWPTEQGLIRLYYRQGKVYIDHGIRGEQTLVFHDWKIPTRTTRDEEYALPNTDIDFRVETRDGYWLAAKGTKHGTHPVTLTCGMTPKQGAPIILWTEQCTRQVWNSILLDMVCRGQVRNFEPVVPSTAKNLDS